MWQNSVKIVRMLVMSPAIGAFVAVVGDDFGFGGAL
jgi:hypothetical protein